jgi:hypothetical protein
VSRHLQLRLEQQPKAIQDLSWKAHVRRCTRDRRLMARGKHANHVVVAMARELAGCIWAIAKQGPVTPYIKRRKGFQSLSAEAQPRCGATLDGVTRPAGILVPRVRPAPDGHKSGGRQPTEISVITRRV